MVLVGIGIFGGQSEFAHQLSWAYYPRPEVRKKFCFFHRNCTPFPLWNLDNFLSLHCTLKLQPRDGSTPRRFLCLIWSAPPVNIVLPVTIHIFEYSGFFDSFIFVQRMQPILVRALRNWPKCRYRSAKQWAAEGADCATCDSRLGKERTRAITCP